MSTSHSSTTRVAIVILNWNGLADTEQCLQSVTQLSPDVPYDVLLIDNDSSEANTDTRLTAMSERLASRVFIIKNSINKGFAGGVNTGIAYALQRSYSHIALLNNDAVVTPLWLLELLRGFIHTEIGIVTGSLLHKHTPTIDSTGEMYTSWGLPYPRRRGKSSHTLPAAGYVFGATGGATIYKREVFESIGLFDEKFFAYYEDTDISWRAQLHGWKIYYAPDAVAYHTQGAASNRVPGFTVKQAIRNLPVLFIKNVPAQLFFSIGFRFFFAYSLITLKAFTGFNRRAALQGYIEGIVLFWSHGIPARRSVQKHRVSTRYIRSIIDYDLPPDQTGLRKLLRRRERTV